MSVEEATKQCGLALQQAASVQLQAHVPKTVQRRQRAASEAESFFSTLPAEWAVSLRTVGPEHVLWYVQEKWLPSHPGGCAPAFPLPGFGLLFSC